VSKIWRRGRRGYEGMWIWQTKVSGYCGEPTFAVLSAYGIESG